MTQNETLKVQVSIFGLSFPTVCVEGVNNRRLFRVRTNMPGETVAVLRGIQYSLNFRANNEIVYPIQECLDGVEGKTDEYNFFYRSGMLQNIKTVETDIENHVKFYKQKIVENVADIEYALDPRSSYLGWENRAVAVAVPKTILPQLKKNKDLTEKWAKVFTAYYLYEQGNADKNTLVEEVEPLGDFLAEYVRSHNFRQVDRLKKSPQIAEIVQQFTIEQLAELSKQIPANGTVKTSLFFIKDFAKRNPFAGPKFYPSEAYLKIANAMSKNYAGSANYDGSSGLSFDIFGLIHNACSSITDNILGNRFVDYVVNEQEPWTREKIEGLMTLVVQNRWAERKMYPIVVHKLLQEYSFKEFLNWLNEVTVRNIKFKNDEWLDYVDNFEEYRDLPIDWWAPLWGK